VPEEADMVALTVTNKKSENGAPYYKAKKILQYLGDSLGLDLLFSPIEADPNYPVTAPFEYRRSALVTDKKTDTFLGIVGEYKKSVSRAFKLPEYTAGFEIGSTALLEAVRKLSSSYKPISRYPSTERDICFRVDQNIQYIQIVDVFRRGFEDDSIEVTITPVDIYKSKDDSKKNITLHVTLTPNNKTLTRDEIARIVNVSAELVVTTLQAVVV
jgi:phenylalanyl-tRNA synthetase beta chain